jgi:hypothetical protein
MQREAEGISEDEMRTLSEQLRQAEERTDGTPLPVTPLDVDAAVEKALKLSVQEPKPAATGDTTPNVVGKWELAEGK